MKWTKVSAFPVNILLVVFAFNLHIADSKTAFSGSKNLCDDVELVTRKEWNARPFWREWRMKTPVNHVIIEHTATPFCYTNFQCIRRIESIQDYHMDHLAWGDIAYNFIVGGDGRIYEGRGWNRPGTHSINFNYNSVGIAFIGNFMNDEPTQAMLNATLKFIKCGVAKGHLTPTREIHGHKDVGCTLSPGDKLYAIIRTWDNYKGGIIKNYSC